MLALLRWWLIAEVVLFAQARRWGRLERWARERERDWGPWPL